MKLDLESAHLKLIQKILQTYLPVSTKVWVFGSRVTGTAKKFSDIDIAIDTGKALTLEQISQLAHVFEESILPYKVDIIDWNTIDDSFKQHIQNNKILIYPNNEEF